MRISWSIISADCAGSLKCDNRTDVRERWSDMNTGRTKAKVGLALSGGGARGLAHIGVLKVLEREGVRLSCLTGSSMGGVVAAAYASGRSVGELEAEALRMSRRRELVKLIHVSAPQRGLLNGNRVRSFLANLVDPTMTFQELALPLGLKAVDLDKGREVSLVEDSVLEAVLATSAFPGVFPPVEIKGRRLVDGGVLNNLPVDLARELGAEVVIGVDVVGIQQFESGEVGAVGGPAMLPDALSNVYQAVMLMCNALAGARLRETPADMLLNVPIPSDVDILTGFTRAEEIITAGEEAAESELPHVLELVGDL